MADVIEEVGNLDFEVGIARYVKTLARLVVGPVLLVGELHATAALVTSTRSGAWVLKR